MACSGVVDIEEITCCSVCLDRYKESGDHIPRILPCSHTYCQECVIKLLEANDGDSLSCPECREMHTAKNGEKSFPQNKYILTYIRLRIRRNEMVKRKHRKCVGGSEHIVCEEHGKEASLFCKESDCKIPICALCLKDEHRSHEVVDIDEDRMMMLEALFRNLASSTSALQARREKVLQGKEEIRRNNRACLFQVRTRKEQLISKLTEAFDELIQEAIEQIMESNATVDYEIDSIDETITMLSSIKESTTTESSHADATEKLETLADIKASIADLTVSTKKFKLYKYFRSSESEDDINRFTGSLRTNEIDLSTTEFKVVENLTSRKSASLFTCKEVKTHRFVASEVRSLELIDEEKFVIVKKDDRWQVCLMDLDDGDETVMVTRDQPPGVAVVSLADKKCVAVANHIKHKLLPQRMKIDFLDAEDWTRVVRSHSVSPHIPGTITAHDDVYLMYENLSTDPRVIRALDCSFNPPKKMYTQSCMISTELKNIIDTSCGSCIRYIVGYTDGRGTAKNKEIVAYQMGVPVWTLTGKFPGMRWSVNPIGITQDEDDHLFVCDVNNRCVQMFTTSGLYMGAILREGEQRLGLPHRIRWCQALRSLVVVHCKLDVWYISVFTVE